MPWDRGLSITGYLPSADYLTQTVNRQVVVVLLLLCYHLWFQIHFSCPCGPPPRNLLHCYGYMLLPGCIIVCLLLWNDLRVGRFLRYSCHFISLERKRSRRKFCFQFLVCVLQASTSGLLWCASVLIDGDWYVCCGVADPAEARPSACVEEEMSRGQKNRRIHLKNQSMVLGLICILLTAACSFALVLPWARWCSRRNYFRTMFEEAVLEQTESILEKEMKKAAADVVTSSLAAMAQVTSSTPDAVEKERAAAQDKILLNVNTNWEDIAFLTDYLIESIPDHMSFKTSIDKT